MMAAVVYGGLLWTGYRRRKGIWTRRSWILFVGSLLVTFVLLGVAFSMATGVDNGIYHGMSRREGKVYFYTMFALVLGGIIASASLILPFARGNPHRQFGLSPKHQGRGPATLQQTDLRDRLHGALVAVGFVMVAERNNPESYGSWQRDYVRGGDVVRLTWNCETWFFTLEGGKSLRRLATKSEGDLSGSGLAEFIAGINGADIVS
jgi:hypothetical protein